MIHKRIIDAAAAKPDAALAEVADDVPGASTDLVERVLDEYGDPADTNAHQSSAAAPRDGDQDSGAGDPAATGDAPMRDQSPANSSSTGDEPNHGTEQTEVGIRDEDTPEEGTGETIRSPATGEPAGHPSADTAPKETESATQTGAAEATDTGGPSETTPVEPEPQFDVDALSEKRRETLRAINAYPEASQRALAEKLGVTAATISQRVNAIDGFEWTDRAELVEGLFEESRAEFDAAFELESAEAEDTTDEAPSTEDTRQTPAPDPVQSTTGETAVDGGHAEHAPAVVSLEQRVQRLEAELEDRTNSRSIDDPELLTKVIHACMDAEEISTDEEHQLIEHLID